ncbi:hypothetical protein GCM10023093_15280 [Nemorincola caseinilytica]|uniref:T9SS C-terminal target domain-containing protein n=1 Tax=Nemorincola caseinilytica TaxID=2054315 RepID=A0ABP8NBK4_9BACT
MLLTGVYATQAQTIHTYAGNYSIGGSTSSGDGGAATAAAMNYTYSVAVDNSGNLYIGEGNRYIRKVSPTGIISTYAGTGVMGYSGDGGPATAADITWPMGIAVDGGGSLYFAQDVDCVVRRIAPDGTISTIAGTGVAGYSGDGGPATAAQMNTPMAVATDGMGNVYISEYAGARVRKVDAAGNISTVAGTGAHGYSGDGGPGVLAQLFGPSGLTYSGGYLYIADEGNNVIRRLNTATGNIETVAGNGAGAGLGSGMGTFSGDGGPALSAGMNAPIAVAVNAATGDLFITDRYNHRIRRVDGSGTISTYTGGLPVGYSGDGGPANSAFAKINLPWGICLDAAGRLYIADELNYVVRRIDTTSNLSPVFSETGMANTCRNTPVALNSLLTAMDANVGQTLSWTVVSGPFHGSLSGFVATAPTTGGLLTPTGLSYTPAPGYVGLDTFTIEISDGYNAAQVMKIAHIDSIPDVGVVTGPNDVCVGDTIMMAFTVAGGTWASSSANATVAGGTVSGITAGTATIYYIVTGTCGADTASKVVNVLPASVCATGVGVAGAGSAEMRVMPNPSSGSFMLYLPVHTGMVSVRDAVGRVVAMRPVQVPQATMTFDDMAPGHYLVTAYTADKEHSVQVVVR